MRVLLGYPKGRLEVSNRQSSQPVLSVCLADTRMKPSQQPSVCASGDGAFGLLKREPPLGLCPDVNKQRETTQTRQGGLAELRGRL